MPDIQPYIYILLPAYNEERSLESLIPKIDGSIRSEYKIILVDDGSYDNTAGLCKELSEEYPIEYLKHDENQGLGSALGTGLRHIADQPVDNGVVVIMDADDTHDPGLIENMLKEIRYSDIIIGSRFIDGANVVGVSRLRRLLTYMAGMLLPVIFKLNGVKDYTSGYRMYDLKLIRKYIDYNKELPVTEKGFAATAELLIKLGLFGAALKEVPMVLRYDLKKSRSELDIMNTIYRYICMILGLKFDYKPKTGKKVLHILNIPWYSGLAGYAIDMAKYMNELGRENIFAVVGNSPLFEKLKEMFPVIALPGRDVFNTLRGLIRLWKIRNEVDIVIAHTGSSCFAGSVISYFGKTKFVRVRAEQGAVKKNAFNRRILKYTNVIVVPSENIKKDIIKIIHEAGKIFFLTPVVNTELFKYTKLPEENTITIIGRLGDIKGHRVLLGSLPLVKEEVGEIKVYFAGSEKDGQWDKLEKTAEKLGVRRNIEYLGYLTDEKVAVVMKNSKVGIIPSLGSEAVSRVALEWMSAGRPVIASNVGILGEVIEDGVNGYIVEPNNYTVLADRIIKLIKDKELNIKLGQNARAYIEEFYSPEVYKDKIKDLISSIES
ncbi:glycosyltransferase [Elusimicrobiota bacterium]